MTKIEKKTLCSGRCLTCGDGSPGNIYSHHNNILFILLTTNHCIFKNVWESLLFNHVKNLFLATTFLYLSLLYIDGAQTKAGFIYDEIWIWREQRDKLVPVIAGLQVTFRQILPTFLSWLAGQREAAKIHSWTLSGVRMPYVLVK